MILRGMENFQYPLRFFYCRLIYLSDFPYIILLLPDVFELHFKTIPLIPPKHLSRLFGHKMGTKDFTLFDFFSMTHLTGIP